MTIDPTGLPFDEAADYLRQKVDLPTEHWTDLREGMHARAFVVAGAQKAELLADFRGALQKALDEGTTLAEFRKDFDTIVQRHGWSYRGSRGWRSRVIYDTNLRMAHAAGRWDQIQRTKDRLPYLEYDAVMDSRTRPEHAALDGTILPVDDPFWERFYPPNGWRCRCKVRARSERQLRRLGKAVSARPPVEMEMRTVRTPSGTATMPTPKGIDTGFGYNVGRAAWGVEADAATMRAWQAEGRDAWERLTPGDWRSAGRPAAIPAEAPRAEPPTRRPGETNEAFARRALGGDQRIVTGPDGTRIAVTAEAAARTLPPERLADLAQVEEVIAEPHEIWQSFERHKATGKVRLRRRYIKRLGLDHPRTLTVQAAGGRFEVVADDGDGDSGRVGAIVWGR